jgi:hypothetical protein
MSDYRRVISEKGVALTHLGLQEVALHRTDALTAIQTLAHMSVPILGGDVYFDNFGKIELAYANWYVDRQPEESHMAFVERSCKKAKEYISSFPDRPDRRALFVLVTASENVTDEL